MVTPFVGVWIETSIMFILLQITASHPSWVCGLKLDTANTLHSEGYVTPFVGVWIETPY